MFSMPLHQQHLQNFYQKVIGTGPMDPARIFYELLAATTDMAILPGVLECRPLRRTVQVRLGSNPAVPRDELPGGTPIFFALAALRSVPQAGSQFRGLATAIHKISGLGLSTVQGLEINCRARIKEPRTIFDTLPR